MTNAIVALMHTTAAYQAAVAQLLIGEANFVGRQLALPGWQAIQTTNEAKIGVFEPYAGVGGSVATDDFKISFLYGRLWIVERIKRTDGPRKNWPATRDEFLQLKSALDTNETRVLARNWLHAVGVDTNRLEQQRIFTAKQSRMRSETSDAVSNEPVPVPFHYLAWIQSSNRTFPQHSIEVRSDAKALWRLQVPDTNHFLMRKMVLTNKAELLGPEPPPRKFVHEMFGGPARFNVVLAPDKVEADLLHSNSGRGSLTVRRGPAAVSGKLAERLSRALTEFDTYAWMRSSLCGPDYGVRLRFYQGNRKVEVLLCFKCSQMLIDGKPGADFDLGHGELLQIMRSVFPRDEALAGVEPVKSKREDYQQQMEKLLKENEAKERE